MKKNITIAVLVILLVAVIEGLFIVTYMYGNKLKVDDKAKAYAFFMYDIVDNEDSVEYVICDGFPNVYRKIVATIENDIVIKQETTQYYSNKLEAIKANMFNNAGVRVDNKITTTNEISANKTKAQFISECMENATGNKYIEITKK